MNPPRPPLSAAAQLRLWARPSLRLQLTGLALAGFVAAVCIMVLSIVRLHGASADAARLLAAHVASSLALQIQQASHAQLPGDTPLSVLAAQQLVDFIHSEGRRDLELVDANLRIVADADHKDIGHTLAGDMGAAVAATLHDGQPRYFVEPGKAGEPGRHQTVVALKSANGASVGALVLEYTSLLDEMAGVADGAAHTLLLLALPVGLLLLWASAWGARRILRPIARLQAATAALASGQHSAKIGEYTQDEVGDLARSFDRMVDHLARSQAAVQQEMTERQLAQQQLQAAHDGLEQRVQERTALLQEANQRLDGELAERLRMARQLEQMARFDPLTGLPNRSLFLNRLAHAMQRGTRTGKLVALIFVDLDRFKSINDSLGHEVGDRVLQEVAQRMTGLLRQTDVVSRIGGDEFTVILEDIEQVQDVATIAAKLVEGFRLPLQVGTAELHCTLSLGIAIAPRDSADIGELMRQADFAMYHAKAEGRNGFQFHSERMGHSARSKLAIEHALRHAIERNEFTLHYQVRVSARSKQPVGMEALLRWHSPELGAVGPCDFIPVAEETGMILPLGAWVLRTACAQHTAWRLEGLQPGVMGINVSARQFRQADFVAQVRDIALEAGVNPAHIELELTESMLMSDPERAATLMGELRALGFGIAIDDFGTGFSSLSHLKRFPATKLKIDRSFVSGIAHNSEDAAIAAAIVALAGTLNIQVTAEGVETEGQRASLDELACNEYQGFLFSHPLPSQGMGEVLRQGLHPGPQPAGH